jgi:hypothetical protein
VELSSMIPLHSAIASSRLVSSLSVESKIWGLVPQGQFLFCSWALELPFGFTLHRCISTQHILLFLCVAICILCTVYMAINVMMHQFESDS